MMLLLTEEKHCFCSLHAIVGGKGIFCFQLGCGIVQILYKFFHTILIFNSIQNLINMINNAVAAN